MADLKHRTNALAQWDGQVEFTYEGIRLAATMAILDEMRRLNVVMTCPNVQKGFRALAKLANQNEATFKRRVDDAVRKRLQRAKGKA